MSDSIIDLEALLAPISEEQPTGVEFTLLDKSFLDVKDAYTEARNLVKEQQDKLLSGGLDSQGKPWRVIPAADWSKIIEMTSSALAKESKDFRLAGWLAEALLRKHGVVGLNEGLLLCKGLCERYWENIRPVATKEDGHGVTISTFATLVADSTYPAILATVLVEGTKPNERAARRYTALDYANAKDPKGRVAGPDETIVELPEFMSVAGVTPPEFHAKNLSAVVSCISTLSWFGEFFRTNCLPDEYDEPTAPGVSGLKSELERVKRMIEELGGTNLPGAPGDENSEAVAGDNTAVQSATTGGGQMTRESAFRTIEEIARFFERTEPHTPVYFALRKVVRWGRMPLPELLAELIEDGGTMESVRKLIGLPQENPDGN